MALDVLVNTVIQIGFHAFSTSWIQARGPLYHHCIKDAKIV